MDTCRLLQERTLSRHGPPGNSPADPHPAVLQHIPMPVLYGVFLHMGVTALNSIQVREGCTGRGCW